MILMWYFALLRDDPVDARNHVAGVADAVVAEHADVHELGAGRNAAGVLAASRPRA